MAWNDLDYPARTRIVRLVYQAKLYKEAWTTGGTPSSLYDAFVRTHGNSFNPQWHYTSAFIHAHKQFLWNYESALVYTCFKDGLRMVPPIPPEECCSVSLPYWMWEVEYGKPVSDYAIFQETELWGDSTTDTTTRYVDTGYFSQPGWFLYSKVSANTAAIQSSSAPYYDNRLKRLLDKTQLRLDPTQVMNNIRTLPNFYDFLVWVHGAGHFGIHGFLSFSMSTMYSPDEPLFFMHHGNVDRFFALWLDCHGKEETSPDSIYVAFNPTPGGKDAVNPITGAKADVSLDAVVPHYYSGSTTCKFSPASSWGSIRQLWGYGSSTLPGSNGLYYRYGRDRLVETFGTTCPDSTAWNLVHYGVTKKRDTKDTKVDPADEVFATLSKTFNELQEQGKTPGEALEEMAMEACKKTPKIELTATDKAFMRMSGIAPSSLDRICDEPSSDDWGDVDDDVMSESDMGMDM
jgi:hypothetical protein